MGVFLHFAPTRYAVGLPVAKGGGGGGDHIIAETDDRGGGGAPSAGD